MQFVTSNVFHVSGSLWQEWVCHLRVQFVNVKPTKNLSRGYAGPTFGERVQVRVGLLELSVDACYISLNLEELGRNIEPESKPSRQAHNVRDRCHIISGPIFRSIRLIVGSMVYRFGKCDQQEAKI